MISYYRLDFNIEMHFHRNAFNIKMYLSNFKNVIKWKLKMCIRGEAFKMYLSSFKNASSISQLNLTN